MKITILLSLLVSISASTLAQPPPGSAGGSDRNRPGPWDNDVLVYRIAASGEPEKLATFDRAGVPTVARLKDGRLIAAFQNFPQDDNRNFDRVAVRFSSDEGRTWTKAEPIVVEGMEAGLARPFDPTLVPLPDGRVRLYFTSNRSADFRRSTPQIFSAISTNGIHYTFEPGVRFGIEGRIVIDCAVALHDGVFHLIAPDNGAADDFMARPQRGQEPMGGSGYHATSKDGLKFERVANVKLSSSRNRWLGNMQSDDGQLVFFGTGLGPWPLTSRDGATWKTAASMRIPGADPGAVKLRDGSWLLLVTGPPRRDVASAVAAPRQSAAIPPRDEQRHPAEPPPRTPSYPIVDTAQAKCYDNYREIAPPKKGEPFYGQDAQFQNHPASYTLSADGLTVLDNVTRLTWQRSPDVDGDGKLTRADKLTLAQAQALPAKLNAAKFGGFDDWRLPTIKELYSLFDGRGTDPSGPTMDADTSGLSPYLDTKFFKFAYGDSRSGERVIDSQYASSTKDAGLGARGFDKLFGVNFADGRIKGYDLFMPGGRTEKTFFVICVRGNPAYGKNDFHDNGDGTITDRATGLMWSKADSGKGMNWQAALTWAQQKNAEKYLGHDDWRLPSVKELQSLVDYTRSPDTSHSPAIDPLFTCTVFTNEAKQVDWPFYWSSTTHSGLRGGAAAMYVAFGRAAGWLSSRDGGPQGNSTGDYRYVDIHGAGAQRSDPKIGDPKMFPHGRGPQGDVIRIFNYVRLVRGGEIQPAALEK